MLSSPALELPKLEEELYCVCLLELVTDSALPLKLLLAGACLVCNPGVMVDNLLCWYCGPLSSSSPEKEVLSLFKLDVEFRLQKDDRATGLEAQPLSMLDMELRLPLVGLRSCGDPTELGVEG